MPITLAAARFRDGNHQRLQGRKRQSSISIRRTFANFAQVQANMAQVGANVVITQPGGSGTVTLNKSTSRPLRQPTSAFSPAPRTRHDHRRPDGCNAQSRDSDQPRHMVVTAAGPSGLMLNAGEPIG